ncbi:hypothetical protein CAPTEDRAFT_193667 [Capitella teleta]|uniref:TIR domain-containing protein n=1 Tax=Capitella teleta TaxID=283909 RepID=R7T8B0_CAPTE|nr:hypothetical protein CAPTEDRAFT_193667 [Capitella teleta]|eukprot:ELT89678.1 hypothetical protein CAPTEDRAFT_193667 [Capitella teleta]
MPYVRRKHDPESCIFMSEVWGQAYDCVYVKREVAVPCFAHNRFIFNCYLLGPMPSYFHTMYSETERCLFLHVFHVCMFQCGMADSVADKGGGEDGSPDLLGLSEETENSDDVDCSDELIEAVEKEVQNLTDVLRRNLDSAKKKKNLLQVQQFRTKIKQCAAHSNVGASHPITGKSTYDKKLDEGYAVPSLNGYEYHVTVFGSDDDLKCSREVVEKLKDKGFKVFSFDNILPNESTVKKTMAAFRKSRKVVALISQKFIQSPMHYEIYVACHEMKERQRAFLIPLLTGVGECEVPSYVRTVNSVSMSDELWLRKLIEVMNDERPLSTLIPTGDVANGLAWSYFYGYMKIILPGLRERVDKHVKGDELTNCLKDKNEDINLQKDETFLKKFICILPMTSVCPNNFDEADENILTIGSVEYSSTISGNVKRNYKTCIHRVQHPEDKSKKFLFMGEFATPLRSLDKMYEGGIAGLTLKERNRQTSIFQMKLKEVMCHPAAEDCMDYFVHLIYKGIEKYVQGTGFFDEEVFEESEQSVMLKYKGVVWTLKTLRRRGVFELSVFELAGFHCTSLLGIKCDPVEFSLDVDGKSADGSVKKADNLALLLCETIEREMAAESSKKKAEQDAAAQPKDAEAEPKCDDAGNCGVSEE